MAAETWKKRWIVLALLAALVGTYLGASVLLQHHDHHSCGDAHHCPICRVFQWARQLLQGTAPVALAAGGLLALRRAGERRTVERAGMCRPTLVSLNVKLTD